MRIYLVGYMGCGKSTVGKRLARAMEMEFIDLDEYIEESEGRSIERIFEEEGESGFRGLEKKHLNDLEERNDFVLSTGGGTPCFYDNMERMNEKGLTIYLEMDVRSLHYRLTHAKKSRPLISTLNEEELYDFIRQHLEQRLEYYENSQMTVNALGFDQKKVQQLAEHITALNH